MVQIWTLQKYKVIQRQSRKNNKGRLKNKLKKAKCPKFHKGQKYTLL